MLSRGVGAASGEPSLLVIAPTRELAIQIQEEGEKLLGGRKSGNWRKRWDDDDDDDEPLPWVYIYTVYIILKYMMYGIIYIYPDVQWSWPNYLDLGSFGGKC